MTKKTITIEDLAGMVERGFKGAADKAEIKELRHELHDLDAKVTALDEKVATKSDLESLRSEMKVEFAKVRKELNFGPEIHELRQRIKRLEGKAGIA
jgi:predicted RNase H-like nuclease (RuvC/YqgF family)